jgi:hypothetical protein
MKKFQELEVRYNALMKETTALVNFILKIRRKCETESLWLIASHDPHKPLVTEEQQGPLVSKLFEMTESLKKKIK